MLRLMLMLIMISMLINLMLIRLILTRLNKLINWTLMRNRLGLAT